MRANSTGAGQALGRCAPLLCVTFVLRLDIRDLGASKSVFLLVVFVSNGDTGVSGRVRDYFCHLCVNALGGRAMPDPKLDGALDTIHELTTRRDDTLAWLDLYIEQDPDRAQLYWFLIDTLTEQPHGCDARIPVG